MAENNIATAEVTINTSRVTGNVKKSGGNNSKELKVLTSILKSMKQSTAIAVKSSKLSLSGLAGAAGIAGGIGSVLTGIGVAIAGAVVGTQAAINEAGRTGGTTFNGVSSTGYFQKAVIDGEDKVIEVNERTGEIVNILTMREARERGILDANDEVYANVLASKGKWAENIKNLDVQGATLHLSLQQLIGLLDEEELAKRNMTEYNRLLQIRNEKLAESIRKLMVEELMLITILLVIVYK